MTRLTDASSLRREAAERKERLTMEQVIKENRKVGSGLKSQLKHRTSNAESRTVERPRNAKVSLPESLNSTFGVQCSRFDVEPHLKVRLASMQLLAHTQPNEQIGTTERLGGSNSRGSCGGKVDAQESAGSQGRQREDVTRHQA
jgi:hypothetical protein